MNCVCRVVALICLLLELGPVLAADWPGWRGVNRDGVWDEEGILETFADPVIPRKWTVPISSGYTGPTVAEGRVFVTDFVSEPRQVERVHCFDAQTGARIWSHTYDCAYVGFGYTAGPRASVVIDEGRAYSLGAMGHLYCFLAEDGSVLWNRKLYDEYQIRMPNWGIAAAPLVEDDLIIMQIGGTDACIVALDKHTGQERWKALPDDASYSAPIVVNQAGQRVLVCWTGNRIAGLAPTTGELYWEYAFPWERWPIAIATPVWHDDLLLFSDAHKGTLLLAMDRERLEVHKRWHRRKEELPEGQAAMHCLISTPYIDGEFIYGADSRGVLRCLRLADGHQVWEDRTAVPEDTFATIHFIRRGDRTWLFNERGELIIAALTPQGFQEFGRAKLLDPTLEQLRRRGGVTWSHPAFASRHIFARNDKELVCADLSAATDPLGAQDSLDQPIAAQRAPLERVRIAEDGKGFILADSRTPFVPWGFNFVGRFGRIVEEYWEDDWPSVEADFRRMRDLGANVVRLHLQVGTYMATAEDVNPKAIQRLQDTLNLARDCGLYLKLTGLGCYHLNAVPPWYDQLAEADRWEVQARFWEAIAQACAGHPAVFCYDLMNEPVITQAKEGEHPWLLGEMEGFYFVQRISNNPAGRTSQAIAEAWVQKLTEAIRRHDRDHLVTIGVIPWAQVFPGAKPLFYAPDVARHLDFVSVHFYPKSGEVDKALTALAVYDVGKPLVVGEIFPLHCTLEELDQFIDGASDRVEGWISHYFGHSIEEHEAGAKPAGELVAKFLKYWREKGTRLTNKPH